MEEYYVLKETHNGVNLNENDVVRMLGHFGNEEEAKSIYEQERLKLLGDGFVLRSTRKLDGFLEESFDRLFTFVRLNLIAA